MKAFTKVVTCVDAYGQAALNEGSRYVVVAKVKEGKTYRDGESKVVKGLIVMEEGSNRAIPYVYSRERFAADSAAAAAE